MNFLKRKFSTSTINKYLNKQKYLFDSFPIVWNIKKSQNSFLYDIHTPSYNISLLSSSEIITTLS